MGRNLWISGLVVSFATMTSCAIVMAVPPSASLGPPVKSPSSVEKNAWLKKVEITDSVLSDKEMKASLENTLTNNLLKYMREGRYFKTIESLPGQPHSEDYILQFRFDRYRETRRFPPHPIWEPSYSVLISTYSAILTIARPDGQIIQEVTASVEEEHIAMTHSVEGNNGLKPRTGIIGDLLRKAVLPTNPVP